MPESSRSTISSTETPKKLSSSFRLPDFLGGDQFSPLWRDRLARVAKPRVLVSAFLATSAFYCFVIGRDRYTAVSEFVIQQAAPLEGSSASVLAGSAAAPQVLTSLVDGQYLQVYLESSDIKNVCSQIVKSLNRLTAPNFLISGLGCQPIVQHQHSLISIESSCPLLLSL